MITCPIHGERFIGKDELTVKNPMTGEERTIANPKARQCSKCEETNKRLGRGRVQPKREPKPVPKGRNKRVSGPGFQVSRDGTVNEADFVRFLEGLEDNPERASELAAASRRPVGVSSAAHGIAVRKASRTPMLNADAKRVTDSLERGQRNYRMPKSGIAKQLIVKPKAMTVGKSQGWWERRWLVHYLKYSKGFCIVTDKGEESRAFPSIGELESAVRKSGWEITG